MTTNTTNYSQVLAIGFLLVILSSALKHNYLPLLVVATYVIAPLPNWICGRCANPDDFMESAGNAVVDFGRFCTGFLVVMGIGKCSRRYTQCFTSRCLVLNFAAFSSPSSTGTQRPHRDPGHDHVNSRRFTDIWDHHKLHNVLSGGARFLMDQTRCSVGVRQALFGGNIPYQ